MKHTNYFLFILIAACIIALGTILVGEARANPGSVLISPTATPNTPGNGPKSDLGIQSGGTQGLTLGASVIVLIILVGILVQQTPREGSEPRPPSHEQGSPPSPTT